MDLSNGIHHWEQCNQISEQCNHIAHKKSISKGDLQFVFENSKAGISFSHCKNYAAIPFEPTRAVCLKISPETSSYTDLIHKVKFTVNSNI